MVFLPHVVRAEYEEGFRIRLTFNDGTEGSVDFESWLQGPVFEPLKDEVYFRKFFLDGGTVAWPDGATDPMTPRLIRRRWVGRTLPPYKSRGRHAMSGKARSTALSNVTKGQADREASSTNNVS